MTAKQTQSETPAMDHAEMARLYADIAEKSGALLTKYMARSGSGVPAMKDELGIAKAFFEAWGLMLTDPVRVAEMQMKLWQDYMALWQNSMSRMMGQETAPVAQPNKTDRRFRHEDWENNFLYDYVKQSYLIAARHLHQSLGSVEGLDEKTAKKVDFYTRQYIDALSPSNFLLTNPEALRETVSSGGQNLVKGLNNLLEDLTRGNGEQLRVRMTDSSAFKLGENLATTATKLPLVVARFSSLNAPSVMRTRSCSPLPRVRSSSRLFSPFTRFCPPRLTVSRSVRVGQQKIGRRQRIDVLPRIKIDFFRRLLVQTLDIAQRLVP